MSGLVCPWWLGYLLATPLRRIGQDPQQILGPHVREGMTILEPGPGMGFFTLDLARLVGAQGKVIGLDVQAKMLRALERRARKAGLMDRIDLRVVKSESMGVEDLAGKVDFVLAFAVVHELPDTERFFREMAAAMKPGAKLLLAEPRGHVRAEAWNKTLAAAGKAGLRRDSELIIRRSHASLLVKSD